MHGSILPKMVFPLFVIGSWAMFVSCISYFTKKNRACPPQDFVAFQTLNMPMQWASAPSC